MVRNFVFPRGKTYWQPLSREQHVVDIAAYLTLGTSHYFLGQHVAALDTPQAFEPVKQSVSLTHFKYCNTSTRIMGRQFEELQNSFEPWQNYWQPLMEEINATAMGKLAFP